MIWVFRILVGLVALFFLVWGARFMFTPQVMAGAFFIEPLAGAVGLGTVRGDLGGLFVAIGALAAIGLRPGHSRYLMITACVIGTVAFGRAVGFAFDGLTPATLTPFVAELVFVAILLLGARQLGKL